MCDELDYAVRWKAACSCSVQMEENASIACDNSMSFNWMFARHLFFRRLTRFIIFQLFSNV